MNFKEKEKWIKKMCDCYKRINELEAAKKRVEIVLKELVIQLNDFEKPNTIGGAEWN